MKRMKTKVTFSFLVALFFAFCIWACTLFASPITAVAAEYENPPPPETIDPVMGLCVGTTQVTAEGEPTIVTTEDELTTALAAGGNIKLGADITATGYRKVAEGTTVVLDLSGYTLDFNQYILRNYGALELCDSVGGGSFVGVAEDVIDNNGRFILTSGTLSNNAPGNYDSFDAAIHNSSEGELIINGGTVTGENNVIYIWGGTVTINGGTISLLGTKGNRAIYNDEGSLTVNGGEINGGFMGIDMYSGTIEMTGGTIYAQYGISIVGDGTVTISGGKISDSKFDPDYRGVGIFKTGGTVTFGGSAEIEITTNYGEGIENNVGTVYMSGGTITATGTDAVGVVQGNGFSESKFSLSGGTITGGIEAYCGTVADCLAPGYLYYDENGDVITLEEGQTELTGTFTVAECKHEDCVYVANGNTIVENCQILNCPHSATATLSVENSYYYDGTEHPATVTYSEGWASGELEIAYYHETYGGVISATVPVDAGTATASITVGEASVSVGYYIFKANVEVGDVYVISPETIYWNATSPEDIVLGRTDTTVPGTLTLNEGQTFAEHQTEYSWTFMPDNTNNYYSATGTVSITTVRDVWYKFEIATPPTKTEYTYGESFDFSGMVITATFLSGATEDIPMSQYADNFSITPDEFTVATTSVTITWRNDESLFVTLEITVSTKIVVNPWIEVNTYDIIYTGQAIIPEIYVYDGDILIPESEYTVTITNNVEVGTATVTIVDVDGGNYIVSGSTTFEIATAQFTNVSVSQSGTLTYTGNALTPTVNASATTVDGATATFTYCATKYGTYTAELPTFVNAGTYTVYVKVNAANHEEFSGSFEIVVEKATNDWIDYPSIQGWTYGETENTPTASATSDGIVVFYYGTFGSNTWSLKVPSDAGHYEMKAQVMETDNWKRLVTVVGFTIEKATPTADLFTFTPPANLNACDGLAKEATVMAKDGVTGVGSITVKYFKDGEALAGAPTAVGTYTVKINVAEGSNYTAIENLAVAKFTYDITDESAHTGVTLVSNNNGTHDKVCSACEKMLADDETCVYEETVNDNYIASEATCISGTTYYKSCECGHNSTETFVEGETDPDNHDWNDTDVCSRCNAVKISEKTFPDEIFRNFILGEFFSPLNDDGVFTSEELAMVKSVRCTYDDGLISDLTGIEYFTEVTELHVGLGRLTSVDLSKNTKLTDVTFGVQVWEITINLDATFDLNTLGIDVSKLTLPDGYTVNDGVIKFETDVYDVSGLTYPSGYGDVLFNVTLTVTNPHIHASVETFDDCTKQEVCLCGEITKAAKEHDFSGEYLSDADGHWRVCENCGQEESKTEHVYDGKTCENCSYKKKTSKKKGCGSFVGGMGGVALFGVVAFILKKRKRK